MTILSFVSIDYGEEQRKKCIYRGKVIPVTELLSGKYYDIEHTVPVSISFDDEFKNLTLADSRYNRIYKGKNFRPNYPTTIPKQYLKEKR